METLDNLQLNFSESQIVKFYENRSIFITGATGFLGTVLLEKLLFSCKDIKNIYVLVKEKYGQPIERRLTEMLDTPVFSRLKEHNPDFIKKIIPIKGNLLEDNLGITESNIRLLQKEVSIVFHVAASISFAMDIAYSVNINTKSTERLVSICKGMPKLTAFIYVSSGYAQSNKSIVDEVCYKPAVSLEDSYELHNIPSSNKSSKILLDGRPNTYTYSKALSEEVLRRNADQIPAIILRPTQILSSVREPFPGWLMSLAGPTGIIEAVSRGLLMCWNSDGANTLDIVPVDYVVNIMIAIAWDAYNRRSKETTTKREKTAKVFNFSSSLQNPVCSGIVMSKTLEYIKNIFGKDTIFTNKHCIFIPNYIYHGILNIFIRLFLTIILFTSDTVLWLIGRNKRFMQQQKRIMKLCSVLLYFTQRQILFLDGNVRRLYKDLNETDKILFNFNISDIEWNSYLRNYAIGIRTFNVFRKYDNCKFL